HWITSVVTGSDRERTAAFSYALPSDAGRAVSTARERTDTAGISATVYCCPAYGVIITSAGNDDREEFSLEFLLHRSSVTGQFLWHCRWHPAVNHCFQYRTDLPALPPNNPAK